MPTLVSHRRRPHGHGPRRYRIAQTFAYENPNRLVIYPQLDLKPGTRYRMKFINGETQTLVALKNGYFRPLLWRIAWRWLTSP